MSDALDLLTEATLWLEQRGPNNSEYTYGLVVRLSNAIRNGLVAAERLDYRSERAAKAALSSSTPQGHHDFLGRATTYQECAGLIREALK